MSALRCADCGELFREEDHPQCWRETGLLNLDGEPMEETVCRDCLHAEWLHRNGIATVTQ